MVWGCQQLVLAFLSSLALGLATFGFALSIYFGDDNNGFGLLLHFFSLEAVQMNCGSVSVH